MPAGPKPRHMINAVMKVKVTAEAIMMAEVFAEKHVRFA